MTEVVAGPNAPAVVIAYLSDVLAEPVHGSVPSTRPASFIRVSSAGGAGIENKGLFRALLTVEAWAETPLKASALALKASAHLEAAEGFYAVCGAPVDFPDPRSAQARAIVTVDLAIRTVVL